VPNAASQYVAADIASDEPGKTVTVFLRGDQIVGIDRAW